MRPFTSFLLAAVVAISLVPAVALAGVYGALRGTVVDESGNPVANVTVTLRAEDAAPQSATTAADGTFFFARVAFDTYTITATSPDGRVASEIVTVASGSVSLVNLKLSQKIIGRVSVHAVGSGQATSVNVLSSQTISTLPGNTSLGKVVQTLPGVVPFSYNEPVSRGFHGVAYEIDGVPIPQTASSEFAEIIDPRDVDRLEVFTGAIPAEFGGERMGAVVDILTTRAPATGGDRGSLSLSGGSYGYGAVSLNESTGNGPFRIYLSANEERTNRGLDTPTFAPSHAANSRGDEFLRAVYSPSQRDTLAFDFSNQYSGFQIPTDTNPSDPNDPCWSPVGTDDNQHEYDRFANVVFNRASSDGKGYFEVAPWYRTGRVTFLPDPANDLAGGCPASTFQDRIGKYVGITTAFARSLGRNDYKVGASAYVENFTSAFSITVPSNPTFFDNIAQRGSNIGLYAQDRIQASPNVSINVGIRWDHSTGFTSGNQISPRFEINDRVNESNTLHFYYGRLYAAPALEDVRRDAVVVGGGNPGQLPVYDLKPERDSVLEAGLAHRFSPFTNGTITLWGRNVTNVLDTTQLGSTPIFTLFNSAIGRGEGVELRLSGANLRGNTWFTSYGLSQSLAEGISGGTFLFPINQLQGANSLAFEDHDQTNTLNSAYTWATTPSRYVTLSTTYGSGFPVQFLNGPSRLPAHVEFGAAIGRKPPTDGSGYGWEISGTNLLNKQYLLKINNGFNTTQYASGRQITLKLTAPIL
jgi:outer membrane receptor protein involved in Fe transport